jgi:DNA-binding transcriptional LysR family regulator
MELRHLRYFLAVAEELNFGRAARRLAMAQPPLSRQIHALETELGVRLFARTRRRVELTDAGRVFVGEARAALAQAERASDAARRAGRGDIGRLAVGFSPVAELGLMPRLLPPFVERHPSIQVDLQMLPAVEHAAAIHAGRIQVGILILPAPARDGLVVERLGTEDLCAVVPASHPLARDERIRIEDLAAVPFVSFAAASSPHLHELILAAFRDAGIRFAPRYEASHLRSGLALVAAGVGAMILPTGSQVSAPGVACRPLAVATPTLDLGMLHRRGEPSQVVRSFIDTARRTIGLPRRAARERRPARREQ